MSKMIWRNSLLYLRYYFTYCHKTKVFFIMDKKNGRIIKPCDQNIGYKVVFLYNNDGLRKSFYEHRVLAQVYIPNKRPGFAKTIDHIDRDKSNNILGNLRWATMTEQQQNKGLLKNSKTGIPNVLFHKRDKRWISKKTIQGKSIYKYCKNKEAAILFSNNLNKAIQSTITADSFSAD